LIGINLNQDKIYSNFGTLK